MGSEQRALSVDAQTTDSNSLLARTRRVLAIRNAHDALLLGELNFVDTNHDILAFERVAGAERLLCVFNLGDTPNDWLPPRHVGSRLIETGEVGENVLGPFAGYIAVLHNQDKS